MRRNEGGKLLTVEVMMKRIKTQCRILLVIAIFLSAISISFAQDSAPIKVACVGDSITFGATIKDRANNSYPAQLGDALGGKWIVKNFGVNSATLLKKGNKPYWQLKQYKEVLQFEPDLVVIKLGTNDSKPDNWQYKDQFLSDYIAFVNSFKQLSSHPAIWICKPVPVFPERWGITDKVVKEEVIPLIEQVARQTDVKVIDLYTALSGKKELFPDLVHPNKEGAAIIASTVRQAIIAKEPVALQSKDPAAFPGDKENWHGFDMYEHKDTRIVVPHKVADGKPWVWRARFFGHEPQFDIAMLNKGYHVVYCDVAGQFGSPKAVSRWNEFYAHLRKEHGFNKRAVLEGMSRGGLIIYNWAAANPEKVLAIYGDAPVMDYKSWPGGRGASSARAKEWALCLKAYNFTEKEALAYKKNPIDNLAPLAKAGIPIIHVVGDADKVVPVSENTMIAETRYKKMGGIFQVIHKPGVDHHPHSLKDPKPLVDFVVKHSEDKK